MNRSQTALLHAKEPQDAAFCASPVLPTTQLAENRLEAVREAVDAILLNCPDPLQVRDGAVHLYGVAQACALIALRRGEDAELAAIAGMLHDLSTYADTYTPDHAARSAALARTLLRRLALFSPEEVDQVCAASPATAKRRRSTRPLPRCSWTRTCCSTGCTTPRSFSWRKRSRASAPCSRSSPSPVKRKAHQGAENRSPMRLVLCAQGRQAVSSAKLPV